MKSLINTYILLSLTIISCSKDLIRENNPSIKGSSDYPLFQTESNESKVGFEFEGSELCVIAINDTTFKVLKAKDVIMRNHDNSFEVQADYASDLKASDFEIVTKPFLYKTESDISNLKNKLRQIGLFLIKLRDSKLHKMDKSHEDTLNGIYNYLMKAKEIDKNINALDPNFKKMMYLYSSSFDDSWASEFGTTVSKNVILPFVDPLSFGVTAQLSISLDLEAVYNFHRRTYQVKTYNRHFCNLSHDNYYDVIERYDLARSDKFYDTLEELNLNDEDKALKGFLLLIHSYMNSYNQSSQRSFKNTLPVLRARTDFGTIFNLLDTETKLVLKTNNNLETLINALSSKPFDMNSPLFNGTYLQGSNSEIRIFEKISKGDWLRQISEGIDLLTLEGYKQYFKEEPSPSDLKAFSDFADLKNKTEIINGKPAPIFEFRNNYNIKLDSKSMSSNKVIDKFVEENMSVLNDFKGLNYPNE